LIQECNANKKNIFNVTRNIFECYYCHVSPSSKIRFNHHRIIQGCNQALDEEGNKLVLKPYPMFEFGQGKKNVQVATRNISMLE
jgi:hypothetical protein